MDRLIIQIKSIEENDKEIRRDKNFHISSPFNQFIFFCSNLGFRSVSSAELTATNSENQSSPSLPITQSTKPINYQVLSSQIASESSSAADSTGSGSSSEQASNAINASNMNKTRKPMTIESLNYLDEPSLNRLIDHCKKTNTFAPLIRNLGRYFSSRDLLVQSFQKRPTAHIDELLQKAPKDLKKLKKEDFRTLEGDLDKDVDSSCCGMEPVAPSMAAATATAGYRKRNDRDVPRHYTSVDLPSLRRAMNHLLETKSSAFDSLNNAMQSLAMNISVDLRMQKQRDKIEEIITVLVIIFEIIIIGKSDFVDVALPSICQAAAYLPIWAQARLAAIWAEHCKDGLRKLLETLQQLISLQVITGAYHENAYVQDNEIIISATKLMKVSRAWVMKLHFSIMLLSEGINLVFVFIKFRSYTMQAYWLVRWSRQNYGTKTPTPNRHWLTMRPFSFTRAARNLQSLNRLTRWPKN